jgi:beta-lactamase superfamily II metal-dependent hydrolase
MRMMDLPKLFILDVAHGNCAILQDTKGTVIIDCAHGDTLIETLRQLNINYVDRIIISHADEDHVKGFIDLLSEESITIGHVYINPDGSKKTRTWTNLRRLITEAVEKKGTTRNFIYAGLTGLEVGEVKIEILAPSMDIVGQAGGLDLDNQSLNSNSVSVVVRLIYKGQGTALLAGDIDQIGLKNLLNSGYDISSKVLVFPHHGGNVGTKDNKSFTSSLCQKVQPQIVVFSIGRDKHSNPRKEVVETVIDSLPDVHIICTQLAKSCSPEILSTTPAHLNILPSKGKEANHCCGGTVVINLNGIEIDYAPRHDHLQFVKAKIISPLCMRS